MAKKAQAKTGSATPGDASGGGWRTYRWLIWALGAGLWLLIATALVSYDPADFPSHSIYPTHFQAHNLVGRFGAVVAYKLYLMLGPGVWMVQAGGLALLIATAMGRRVDQIVLRTVGVIMMCAATSALISLAIPDLLSAGQARPEGTGGLLAIFIVTELTDRFSTLGTSIILIVGFWVGAVLALDRMVIAATCALGRKLKLIGRVRVPRPVLVGRFSTRFGSAGTLAPAKSSRVPVRRRGQADEAEEPIDEDAGGLGGTESFDIDESGQALLPDYEDDIADADPTPDDTVDEDDEDDAAPPEASPETDEADDDAGAHDAPGAYLADEKQPFDPEALREKIRKMPINFAASTKGKMPAGATLAGIGEPDFSGYQFPGLDLLEDPESNFTEAMEKTVRDQAVKLESAMQQYHIEGNVVGIDSGPVITLFEVRLAPGTKVSRVNTIASDLARALKAQSIRVVPNIAGRDTIGVEVPNIEKEKVRLKELMIAGSAAMSKMKLPMFLGKDASGNPLIADLNAMPHMLIAGTTGSGKSVCMNAIIMSFLYTKRPDELKLVLVDPKMVEMSLFRDIPHLMCPVVTEMSKAVAILEWAVTKMDERYELLAEVGVRDIAGYNGLTWEQIVERMEPAGEAEEARIPKKLPYMVFVVDELADIMMTNKEVEGFIVRIAQKARAVGIHLILATQRPEAKVVTGLIKSNLPCRVSFKVASGMDSRIVLDSKGAEVLLGQGDMLYLSPRTSKLTRAQGCLVDDGEIRKVVRFVKEIAEQNFEPQLIQLKAPGMAEDDDDAERDPLFDDAVRIVLESKRGSVSLLQRRLTIGYSRSSRLIEQMADAGIIGAYKGSQAREVNLTVEEWDALKAQAEADAEAEADGDLEATDEVDTDEEEVDEDEDEAEADDFEDEEEEPT